MALRAIEEAKKDPRYIKASAIAQESQQLEDEIEQLEAFIAQESLRPAEPERTLDTYVEVSDETRRLLEKFEALSKSGGSTPKTKTSKPQEVKIKQPEISPLTVTTPPSNATQQSHAGETRRKFSDATARLEQLRATHKAKINEFQKEIDAMIPNPNDPPEIKRNFACARMIKTVSGTSKKVSVRVAWICNECHIRHNNPSECAVKEFGGNWVYEDRTINTETISHNSVNI